jgi:UDP-hydrolysing UDP-N-acetyl-D-glucosamine 2-epimerase
MALTTGILLQQVSHVLNEIKPDLVVVHGDRYEVLACATAASYMNIPILHTEGGEQTGCIDDKVRNAITALADYHCAVTMDATKRLYDLVGKIENIYTTGSPAIDAVLEADLEDDRTEPYMLVLHHPNTTSEESIEPLIDAIAVHNDIKVVWVNPNVDAGSHDMLKKIHKQNVEFQKDLSPSEYYRLLANAKVAIGNSSSFIKEGCFLGVPAVIIGDRQDRREHGDNVVFATNDTAEILLAISRAKKLNPKLSYKFGTGNAAQKIVEVIKNG